MDQWKACESGEGADAGRGEVGQELATLVV